MKTPSLMLSASLMFLSLLTLSTSVFASENHSKEITLPSNDKLVEFQKVYPATTLQIVSITAYTFNGGVNIRCWGQNTGQATVLVSGGTAPYTYSWLGLPNQTSEVASGLFAGTYTVVVTDATGTSVTDSITLTQNPPLQAIASASPVPCYGGVSVVTISASGGTPQYSGLNSYDVVPGTYYFTVADANGCRDRDTVVVTEPDILEITATPTPIMCYGDTSQVTVAAIGGTFPYTGTGVFDEVAGTYTYYISDANGCTEYASVVVTEPDIIQANVSPQNLTLDCIPIPVAIDANPTGGVAPYSYAWSNGSTNSSITVNPNETTTYALTITDANGCTVNSGSTVSVLNRCGKKNHKVVICHVPPGNPNNPQTICISQNALNPHLATTWDLHGGDYCGPCSTIGSGNVTSSLILAEDTDFGNNSFIRAAINTKSNQVELSYRLTYDSKVRVEIYDLTGALVEVIHENDATEGKLFDLSISPTKFTSGVYIYQFITDKETHIDKMQFVQ